MIDTPRTDNRSFYNEHGEWVNSAFARQLERELNAANERIKRLEESVSYWNDRYNDLNHKVQNRDNY